MCPLWGVNGTVRFGYNARMEQDTRNLGITVVLALFLGLTRSQCGAPPDDLEAEIRRVKDRLNALEQAADRR